jgi:crotonobetainyl-CoA:carnitine CoA-transferase CaiB-like acyl-CoA transferase
MPPLGMIGGIADQMGAIMTSYGIVVALVVRERCGIGQKVDVSHLGSMIALQGLSIALRLYLERELPRHSRRKAPNPLWNHYQCKDGKWLALGMLQPDRQWPFICKALGIEHLEKDPRFENLEKRQENCQELISILDNIFITKSSSEWMKALKEAGDIICIPIQTVSDLLNDPQVQANEYIVNLNHRVLGPMKTIGIPIQFSKTPGQVKCEAPELGEHTEEVLIGVGGYTWEEIAALKQEGVI